LHTFVADTVDLGQKAMPRVLGAPQWTGPRTLDGFRQRREPNANDLLYELKATAWTCASLNAQTCAAHPPKLYVTTKHNQPAPKCRTKALQPRKKRWLAKVVDLAGAQDVEEVTDHPILDLFKQVNPVLNSFDLWELTTLYQEVHGSCFWFLDLDGVLGVPSNIWILPSQNMTPKREPDSTNLVDYYEYRIGKQAQKFRPEQIIHFRYPDPRDPYTSGLSPLRACFEQVATAAEYTSFKRSTIENHAIPDALISPDEVIGEEERDRLETQINQRFRKGGGGRVMVAESGMKIALLQHSMGDLAALAEMGANKELILNAFHVPVAFLSSSTNLANLQASNNQHSQQAVMPRLTRRDEKLNEQFVPLYDPSGRLFLKSDDPTPADPKTEQQERRFDAQIGVRSINEIRSEDGLPPVAWGDMPWMAATLMQPDQLRALGDAKVKQAENPPKPVPMAPGKPVVPSPGGNAA
jgi:HK97 family phage portal protein